MNPTPPINGNYSWISEIGELDSMLTYNQSKHATLTALQNAITNIYIIYIYIYNIQTEITNLEIPDQGGNSSKELRYNTTHPDYTFQNNVVNNHRTFTTQQHYLHTNEK